DDEDSRRIGERLLEESHLLFSYGHPVRDGTLKRSSFQVYASNIRQCPSLLDSRLASLRKAVNGYPESFRDASLPLAPFLLFWKNVADVSAMTGCGSSGGIRRT
ncbi:MAG: hypothetical protein D6812_05725, partial [Deltaproteobacteria bacterium]